MLSILLNAVRASDAMVTSGPSNTVISKCTLQNSSHMSTLSQIRSTKSTQTFEAKHTWIHKQQTLIHFRRARPTRLGLGYAGMVDWSFWLIDRYYIKEKYVYIYIIKRGHGEGWRNLHFYAKSINLIRLQHNWPSPPRLWRCAVHAVIHILMHDAYQTCCQSA